MTSDSVFMKEKTILVMSANKFSIFLVDQSKSVLFLNRNVKRADKRQH